MSTFSDSLIYFEIPTLHLLKKNEYKQTNNG